MMTDQPITIMLSAKPGLLRDSIYAILMSYSNVKVVGGAILEQNCLNEIDRLHPDIVLIDCTSMENFSDLITSIKTTDPGIKCVAISGSISTNQLIRKDGPDYVLRSFSGRDIQMIVHDVCQNKKVICKPTDSLVVSPVEAFHENQ